jgi:hypothetical protein
MTQSFYLFDMHDSCSFAGGTIIDDLSEHAGYADIVENKLKKKTDRF